MRHVLVATLLATLIACADGGPGEGDLDTPESAFRKMQTYVAEGQYDKVWGLLSSEARRQWADGVNDHKTRVLNAGVNRAELERLVEEQYRVTGREFQGMSPESLYAKVMWKGADGMARLRIATPAEITGDRATLSITKDMPGGQTYPPFDLPYVRRGGRWLIARNPTDAGGVDPTLYRGNPPPR